MDVRSACTDRAGTVGYVIPPPAFWLVVGAIFAVHAAVAAVTGSAVLFGVLCSVTAILASLTYFTLVPRRR
jgi:hypothetical protein